MKGKRCFISGGAGVIGLEMVPRLVARGATVLVGDIKPRPATFGTEVNYWQGDLNEMTSKEIEAFAPEVFIHLAATFERSTETYGFWQENFWHNVRLSHHLMSLVKDLPSLRRVVFASSYLIYDQALYQFDTLPSAPTSLVETDPVMPRNLTGMAKLAHEVELRFLEGFRADSFTTACARIYRGYGCNSRDVISRWVRALLTDEPIKVYRPEGMFDYIYAKDTAEGLIRLADAEAVVGIYNLGTGHARRVQDVVDILRRYFPDMQARQESSDIPFEASQADITAFKNAINWVPEYDIERAIPEIIAHERSRLDAATKAGRSVGNVLVTSASRKAPLVRAVQKAVRKLNPAARVFAGDLDENALTRYVADDFWAMPRIDDAVVGSLIDGCRDRGIDTIIPTRDGELSFWARHRDRFLEAGIDVVVSPAESIAICVDKFAFAQFGQSRQLPFIPTGMHPDEVKSGSYVVKERFGAGARSIGIDLDREAALRHGAGLENPVYQPFVPGREISVDAWMDVTHRVKGLILRSRDQVVGGESQVTTTFRDANLEASLVEVLNALRLRGPAVLQAIVDPQGQLHIIECNARFGGASTASIAAGLDIFYWSLLERTGGDVAGCAFARTSGEVRQVRLPEDIHVHDSHL